MYRDMKRTYYWEGMKKDVGNFISKCMNCQLVKAEQKKPSGLLKPLEVLHGSGSKCRWILSMDNLEPERGMKGFGS